MSQEIKTKTIITKLASNKNLIYNPLQFLHLLTIKSHQNNPFYCS